MLFNCYNKLLYNILVEDRVFILVDDSIKIFLI